MGSHRSSWNYQKSFFVNPCTAVGWWFVHLSPAGVHACHMYHPSPAHFSFLLICLFASRIILLDKLKWEDSLFVTPLGAQCPVQLQDLLVDLFVSRFAC
jgi:hypothetical protein